MINVDFDNLMINVDFNNLFAIIQKIQKKQTVRFKELITR